MSLVGDHLDPAVEKQFRFEDGNDYRVRARPRKGVGFVDRSVISFRLVDGRSGAGIPLSLVRLIAADGPMGPDDSVLAIQVTRRDAEMVCAWLDSLN